MSVLVEREFFSTVVEFEAICSYFRIDSSDVNLNDTTWGDAKYTLQELSVVLDELKDQFPEIDFSILDDSTDLLVLFDG